MHQPYYLDPTTGELILPWVRLHAAKDYLHMAQVLARYPDVHVTFNVVPCLAEQIQLYAVGQANERLLRLSRQSSWTREEREYLLNLCFSIDRDRFIRPYPRYVELLSLRPQALQNPDILTDQEYQDLLVWFQLAWTDPNHLEGDPDLQALVRKGCGFDQEDTELVLQKHQEICKQIVPTYRELEARGQLEITTSPYFHSILPLLVGSEHARRATPGLPLPDPPFAHPEDVDVQLQLAVAAHEQTFGRPPRGLWPSEGAVSPEILPAVQRAGLRWLASDEIILARSLWQDGVFGRDGRGIVEQPHALYQPYRLLMDSELGPAMVFRDHDLSDRIGFIYQHLPGAQAAEDLIVRLHMIRDRLNDPGQPYLVSIILDGENCWEQYEHNGDVFLNSLYRRLSDDPTLQAVTVSEFLEAHPPRMMLAKLATGSWIGGDLTTWIGDPEHNLAWEALEHTRVHLEVWERQHSATDGRRSRAWRAIYIAEGSDWFWWYSHRNRSDQDELFDRTFRANLAVVYRMTDHPLPDWLITPIQPAGVPLPATFPPRAYIYPRLTADPDPTACWADAGALRPVAVGGAMQQAEQGLRTVWFGYNPQSLFLRIETVGPLSSYTTHVNMVVELQAGTGQQWRWRITLPANASTPFLYEEVETGTWHSRGPVAAASGEQLLELEVALRRLGVQLGDRITLSVCLEKRGQRLHCLPVEEAYELELRAFPARPSGHSGERV